MDYDVHETKAAIKTVIETCAPLATVFDWWVLGDDHKKWPALLESHADLYASGKPRTHGYVIEFAEAEKSFNSRRGGGDTQEWWFKIIGLHYHHIAPVEHSSKLFLTEVFKIADVFKREPAAVMPLPGALNLTQSFEFIHRVMPFGNEMRHAMEAKLLVRPC